MIIDKSIKRVTVGNTDIQRIMHGGGILWQKIDDLTGSPGPKALRGGNLQAGFYGEVPASNFITGDELARRIGLTAGVSQYSNEPWLKFSYLGKVEFVAKKPFRHTISWNQINEANAVFGNTTINIDGLTFKVRLFKGKTEGKQNEQSMYAGTINHGSEWNKLMLPIYQNAPSNWKYPDNVNSPTENWGVGYTEADLLTHDSRGFRMESWCQEYGTNITRLTRGGGNGKDVSYANAWGPKNLISFCGWRPVLELVKE